MLQEAEVSGRKVIITIPGLTSSSVNQALFTPPSKEAKYIVKGASARWHTASTSAKLQLEVAGAAIAIGSGVNQLDNTLDTSATADTTVFAKASTPTVFGNESSLNLIISGTKTNLADCSLTVELEKVN